ncbi:MAG: Rpn family recombination-promoting nuclease/putative transposase [Fibrobacter sp.]|nr:Rpn family recombination-promoting nuclease/putative transposase [Fibrobacter sp.]
MSEKESIENNTPQESPDSVIRDIAHEFQVILDSVEGESNFTHDRFLRFAFADPERMAELLTLFSRHNPTLKAFLDTIDLSTLHGASENFSSDKHVGYSDLVFEAQIKDGGTAALYVGIIAEHKSSEDSEVMKQISEYYHHLYLERKKDVPVVAFIVYNGENDWNPLSETHYAEYPEFYHDIGYPFKVEFLDVGHAIDDKELKDFSPFTLVALTAMKYIWNAEQFSATFREAAMRLLKWQNTDKGRDFIKQALSYFLWKWPYKRGNLKMDRPEIVANKGYETFAEHFVNVGIEKGAKQEREKSEAEIAARDSRREDYLRSQNIPEDVIAAMRAIK